MSIAQLKESIPDFGRDIRLNLGGVLSPEGSPGLTNKQIWGVALACAYSLGDAELLKAVLSDGAGELDDATTEAGKSAATITVAPHRSTAAPEPNRGGPNPTRHGPSAPAEETTRPDGEPTCPARRGPTAR